MHKTVLSSSLFIGCFTIWLPCEGSKCLLNKVIFSLKKMLLVEGVGSSGNLGLKETSFSLKKDLRLYLKENLGEGCERKTLLLDLKNYQRSTS